ncbi:hypothetical protein NPIL_391081 [Nephila pilipes]|uniref:Secreted protein n=1 Tax=Nephila pilipes TaxID=299642 RepID=A0A8X6PWQ6_NEPPI|nr:hypothetical protein NPIL_391081 [Nephila pilipes]
MMPTHIIPILTAAAIMVVAAKGQSTSVSLASPFAHLGHKHSMSSIHHYPETHHCCVPECISFSQAQCYIRIRVRGTALYVEKLGVFR